MYQSTNIRDGSTQQRLHRLFLPNCLRFHMHIPATSSVFILLSAISVYAQAQVAQNQSVAAGNAPHCTLSLPIWARFSRIFRGRSRWLARPSVRTSYLETEGEGSTPGLCIRAQNRFTKILAPPCGIASLAGGPACSGGAGLHETTGRPSSVTSRAGAIVRWTRSIPVRSRTGRSPGHFHGRDRPRCNASGGRWGHVSFGAHRPRRGRSSAGTRQKPSRHRDCRRGGARRQARLLHPARRPHRPARQG
jgi:hypothetical protein